MKRKKKYTKQEIIIGLLVNGAILLYFIVLSYKQNRELNRIFDYLDKNYQHISITDSLKNKVISIYHFPENLPVTGDLGVQDVELDDGRKIELRIDKELSNRSLGEILQIGDSVLKSPGSDTLVIKKRHKVYKFIILKD